jgi:hypothetical protein
MGRAVTAAKGADELNAARDTGTPNRAVWEALTAPFPASEVEKLPKNLRRQDDDRGQCRPGTKYSADGHYCGGYHARSLHLDYVGHAGITMRLNDVVTPAHWNWEPIVYGPDGVPVVGREFWIRLTVMGVTKLGVGDDFNGSAKQAIGDALRNAAMRFGIGTYLWSKSDASLALKRAEEGTDSTPPPPIPPPATHAATPDLPAQRPERPPPPRGKEVPMATDKQTQRLAILLGDLTPPIHDRALKIAYCSEKVGRTIESSKDLTFMEARGIIDELEVQVAQTPRRT